MWDDLQDFCSLFGALIDVDPRIPRPHTKLIRVGGMVAGGKCDDPMFVTNDPHATLFPAHVTKLKSAFPHYFLFTFHIRIPHLAWVLDFGLELNPQNIS
jgi:hypothetical protein